MLKNQHIFFIGRVAAVAVIVMATSCGRRGGEQVQPRPGTVASLSPAATDLIEGIGAGGHLVGQSDYDNQPGIPRVGDFDHVDWEKLAAANPAILVTQFGSRMPPGLLQRCQELGIQVIDVRLDNLADTYREADVLGAALGEEAREKAAVKAMQDGLAGIAARVAGKPKVKVAIAMFDGGSVGLIGADRFHSDLLTIAGGINVAAPLNQPFAIVDGEQLTALAPDVIFDLEPVPPTTPQELDQDSRFWASLPMIPAVHNGRVYRISDSYCRQPGWHAVDLADTFARKLHDN